MSVTTQKKPTLTNGVPLSETAQRKSTLTNGAPLSETAQQDSAPSILLNLHGSSKSGELYMAVLYGIVLQFGMVVFCGFSVYHLEFS